MFEAAVAITIPKEAMANLYLDDGARVLLGRLLAEGVDATLDEIADGLGESASTIRRRVKLLEKARLCTFSGGRVHVDGGKARKPRDRPKDSVQEPVSDPVTFFYTVHEERMSNYRPKSGVRLIEEMARRYGTQKTLAAMKGAWLDSLRDLSHDGLPEIAARLAEDRIFRPSFTMDPGTVNQLISLFAAFFGHNMTQGTANREAIRIFAELHGPAKVDDAIRRAAIGYSPSYGYRPRDAVLEALEPHEDNTLT